MNPSSPSASGPTRISLATPAAAVEILVLFGAVALAALGFLLGWLRISYAEVLTALLLVALVALAWRNFDQGRHPCFLFLSTLLLLQGGRLLIYCLGGEPDPLRIRGMSAYPFDLTRDQAGTVLLCVALSAVCIYAPCRWSYRRLAPPPDTRVRQYLPFLYLVFYAALPIQLFKNYEYYQYIQEHGGYLQFWVNHGDIAASVPWVVRGIVLLSLPALVAIFVFEKRRRYLYLATAAYLLASIPTLLLGLRGGVFALVLTLWYVAAVKSTGKSRIVAVAALGLALVLVGDVVQTLREDTDTTLADYTFAPLEFVRLQGNSLDVTSAAVKYRSIFAPYAGSYLRHELGNAFVANDTTNYFRGKSLAFDVPVLLNADAFSNGRGTGGSYIGEAYVLGALPGVLVISWLIGCGLQFCHRASQDARSLFLLALVLPDILTMPRGNLLDWLSVLGRALLSLAILGGGWQLFCLARWLKRSPRGQLYSAPGQLPGLP
ncbi:MAG: O-antigen polysaccharide polymerase Wzy [Candidatus Korobacteraceae bacterium]